LVPAFALRVFIMPFYIAGPRWRMRACQALPVTLSPARLHALILEAIRIKIKTLLF
jgi:hypothetical protein